MADINLIPDQYRYWLWQQRVLKQCAVALCMVALAVLAFSSTLHIKTETRTQQLAELRDKNAISQQDQQKFEVLSQQSNELQRQWHVLAGLRGGTAMENMFIVIDRALQDEQVWFRKWDFTRAGYSVNADMVKNAQRERGAYFIPMKSDNASSSIQDTWAIETHLEISGGATDHVAFSDFIERLLNQPEISNVKIVSTAMEPGANALKSIVFKIAILVNSAVGSSS